MLVLAEFKGCGSLLLHLVDLERAGLDIEVRFSVLLKVVFGLDLLNTQFLHLNFSSTRIRNFLSWLTAPSGVREVRGVCLFILILLAVAPVVWIRSRHIVVPRLHNSTLLVTLKLAGSLLSGRAL